MVRAVASSDDGSMPSSDEPNPETFDNCPRAPTQPKKPLKSLSLLFTQPYAKCLEHVLEQMWWRDVLTCSEVSKHINRIVTTSTALQLRLRKVLHLVRPNRARSWESEGQQLRDIVRSQSALHSLRPYAVTYYDAKHVDSPDPHHNPILSGGFLLTYGRLDPTLEEGEVDSFLITDLKTVGNRRPMVEAKIMVQEQTADKALYTKYDARGIPVQAQKTRAPDSWYAKINVLRFRVAIRAEDDLLVIATVRTKKSCDRAEVTAAIKVSFFHMIPPNPQKGRQQWVGHSHRQSRAKFRMFATKTPGARVKEFNVKLDASNRVAVYVHFGVRDNDYEREEERTIAWDWRGSPKEILPTFDSGANPPLQSFCYDARKRLYCLGPAYEGLGVQTYDERSGWHFPMVDFCDLGNVGGGDSDNEDEDVDREISTWDFGVSDRSYKSRDLRLFSVQWDGGYGPHRHGAHLGLFSYVRCKDDERVLIAGAFQDLSDPTGCDAVPIKDGSCDAAGTVMVTLARQEDAMSKSTFRLAITNYDSNAVKTMGLPRPLPLGTIGGSFDALHRLHSREQTILAMSQRDPVRDKQPILRPDHEPDYRTFNGLFRSPCGSHWESGLPAITVSKVEVSMEMHAQGDHAIGDVLFDGQMIVVRIGKGFNILYF